VKIPLWFIILLFLKRKISKKPQVFYKWSGIIAEVGIEPLTIVP
jgi:hypothetical protein